MSIYKYKFIQRGEPLFFQNGDIVKVNTEVKTLAFFRNNERVYTNLGDDKIYVDEINAQNAPILVQKIVGLTPVLDTNDSSEDTLIFKLSGK